MANKDKRCPVCGAIISDNQLDICPVCFGDLYKNQDYYRWLEEKIEDEKFIERQEHDV